MTETSETIHPVALLVEDDESVRGAVRRMLKELGFSVVEARHGRQAIDLLTDRQHPIDLLLTDVVMPFVRGNELAQIAVSLRPDIRVAYISGHIDDPVVVNHLSLQPNFLQKPFGISGLKDLTDRVMQSEDIWL
jgi:DNA-binding NtrC family response regulator